MERLFILLLLFTILGCQPSNSQEKLKETTSVEDPKTSVLAKKKQIQRALIPSLKSLKLTEDLPRTYSKVKALVEKKRANLTSATITTDSLSKLFKQSLLQRIIPFWEGTEWSFEGHTSKPSLGKIACGYFVSTTLQDIGLKINRYKLAQQNPLNEAKSLALKLPVLEIEESTPEQNIKTIQQKLPEGIHFIGFDQSHVGYILKQAGELYLIHSNYLGARGVEIEPIATSQVFSAFQKFYLAEISTNKKLLDHWVQGKTVKVIIP